MGVPVQVGSSFSLKVAVYLSAPNFGFGHEAGSMMVDGSGIVLSFLCFSGLLRGE